MTLDEAVKRLEENLDVLGRLRDVSEEQVNNSGLRNGQFALFGELKKRFDTYDSLTEESELYIGLAKQADTTEGQNYVEGEINTLNEELGSFIQKEIFRGIEKGGALISIKRLNGREDIDAYIGYFVDAYQNFAGENGLEVEVLDKNGSSAVLKVSGDNAYALFMSLNGNQRIEYKESNGNKTQTGSVNVEVIPYRDEKPLGVKKSDIQIGHYGGSTKGGQHANKSKTNVKLTHEPTGITAVARGRSRKLNERNAYAILYSKLDEHFRNPERENITGGFGHWTITHDMGNSTVRARYTDAQANVGDFREGRLSDFVTAYHLNRLERP